ncbi:MAG TPA: hypothetical protein VHQ65_16725 [Thermoanaerobaculia bacterium]|nr:hypothetical protein [Thermoanaerobaculia bacterium]
MRKFNLWRAGLLAALSCWVPVIAEAGSELSVFDWNEVVRGVSDHDAAGSDLALLEQFAKRIEKDGHFIAHLIVSRNQLDRSGTARGNCNLLSAESDEIYALLGSRADSMKPLMLEKLPDSSSLIAMLRKIRFELDQNGRGAVILGADQLRTISEATRVASIGDSAVLRPVLDYTPYFSEEEWNEMLIAVEGKLLIAARGGDGTFLYEMSLCEEVLYPGSRLLDSSKMAFLRELAQFAEADLFPLRASFRIEGLSRRERLEFARALVIEAIKGGVHYQVPSPTAFARGRTLVLETAIPRSMLGATRLELHLPRSSLYRFFSRDGLLSSLEVSLEEPAASELIIFKSPVNLPDVYRPRVHRVDFGALQFRGSLERWRWLLGSDGLEQLFADPAEALSAMSEAALYGIFGGRPHPLQVRSFARELTGINEQLELAARCLEMLRSTGENLRVVAEVRAVGGWFSFAKRSQIEKRVKYVELFLGEPVTVHSSDDSSGEPFRLIFYPEY